MNRKYQILLIVLLGVIPSMVYGISYNDWDCNDSWASKATVCYLGNIFEQNKQLIQEQNQTNNLIATQICEKNYFVVQYSNDNTPDSKDFKSCIKQTLESTK